MASNQEARRSTWVPRGLLIVAVISAALMLFALPPSLHVATQWLCGVSAVGYVIALFALRDRQA